MTGVTNVKGGYPPIYPKENQDVVSENKPRHFSSKGIISISNIIKGKKGKPIVDVSLLEGSIDSLASDETPEVSSYPAPVKPSRLSNRSILKLINALPSRGKSKKRSS
jgi:hypothetical protein